MTAAVAQITSLGPGSTCRFSTVHAAFVQFYRAQHILPAPAHALVEDSGAPGVK